MEETYIKHMAFAVRDARAALKTYQDLLGVGLNAKVEDYPKSRNRVALFNVGGVEYQLCQSLDKGGRFDAWIETRGLRRAAPYLLRCAQYRHGAAKRARTRRNAERMQRV
jgi:catechol 2,3-dioxygenase-like lactoylglutathione lyase family enzyme